MKHEHIQKKVNMAAIMAWESHKRARMASVPSQLARNGEPGRLAVCALWIDILV